MKEKRRFQKGTKKKKIERLAQKKTKEKRKEDRKKIIYIGT